MWTTVFLNEKKMVGRSNSAIPILCDNTQTAGLVAKNQGTLNTKLRHISINDHWLRQEQQLHRIDIHLVPSEEEEADGFTKALPTAVHRKFLKAIGMEEINTD